MNQAATADNTFELLHSCIRFLGAAVLPIWGLDEKGYCRCAKGTACTAAGKHPYSKFVPNGVNGASRDPSIVRQWVRTGPRWLNWAIRCGEPTPDGGFLGAFDWDPRNGAEVSLEEIQARGCELPDTVVAQSGGGGGHRLYRFPVQPASRSVGPGLDLQGAGKYIVIAPSRHRSGGVYTWELGSGPGETPIAEAPAWLADGTEEAVPRPTIDGGTARETVLGEAFALAGRAGPVMPDGTMYVNCVQSHLHSDARGRGQDASTVILPPAGGSKFGGYKCLHGHCANLKWEDVKAMLPKEHFDAAERKYPRLAVVPAKVEAATPAPVVVGAVPGNADPTLTDLQRRLAYKTVKSGYKIISDIVNLNTILTYHPLWKGVLQWDEFGQVLRFTREPPWHPDDAPKDKSDVWHDGHTTCLDLWLRRNWQLELAAEKIRESVYVVGRRDSVNPLRDWLQSLRWDGVSRIDTWLPMYLGVKDTPYARSAGRKWLISAVARGISPGIKVDTLLVLEGPQGKGKSTALRTLVPHSEWFSDTPIPLGDKDSYVGLRGKWIIELAELASLKKADLDKAKAFFSSPADSYRPPYGRELQTIPRCCVFAGTVNLGAYLTDTTGGRRFWPVKVGVIDLAGLAVDREQLWAEAVHIYQDWVARGRPMSECLWWPSADELHLFEAEQAEREVSNPWSEAIAIWIQSEKAAGLLKAGGGVLNARQIAMGALGFEDKDLSTFSVTSITDVMTRELGWAKVRSRYAGVRSWAFAPPEVS